VERLSTHAELQELLGAYALDAVDADEAAAIERHLPTCPRCRNELTDHREVAALLGNAGGAAPTGVWDRIVASLEEPAPAMDFTRAQLFAQSPPPPRPAPVAGTMDFDAIAAGWGPNTPPAIHGRAPQSTGEPAPVVPIGATGRTRRRRSVPMGFMVALASAAAVVVAALGVEVGRLEVHKSTPTNNLAALAYQVADANPSAHHLRLTSTDGVETIAVVIVPDGMTYLGPGNLQTLSDNETYQMWGIINGARVSLGVIGDSPTYAAFTTPSVASVLAMTVEERGGVVTSTKTPVVAGVLPNA
jgi:anti-sigma factor RsiW